MASKGIFYLGNVAVPLTARAVAALGSLGVNKLFGGSCLVPQIKVNAVKHRCICSQNVKKSKY